jgi:hypothetical protein
VGREAFDLAARPLDHSLKVDHELLVYRVVCGTKGVEGGGAGSVEDPEHGEVLVGVNHHRSGGAQNVLR